ncbi:MAG TPA: FTR1 family protein [Beijerinckiaceae bacterium]|jgi:high-affinity iron transporter|nr:FTR1 family protein [Beijerinckiaceae bacterium]
MLGALLIVFREVVEAGLIVGIVLAVTQGMAGRNLLIAGGIGAGLIGASVVAAFAGVLSELFEGSGQELFNACVLILAAIMLGWHNIWMARHGREIAEEMYAVGRSVFAGNKPPSALAIVIAIAVLREGSEVVLFLYGIVVSHNETGWSIALGGVLGLAAGIALSALTYVGLIQIPARRLFQVTSALIALMAAGMAAQAIAFLAQADIATALGARIWDTSRFIADDSILGRVLHTLFGYTDRPTELQFLVYLATLALILGLMRVFAPARASPRPRLAPGE